MEQGLAAMYGSGEGNTVTHYYAGRPDTARKNKKKEKSMAKKKCNRKPGKK